MGIEFVPVKTEKDIEELAEMASAIWHEYWPILLSPEQIDYMVSRFQSVEAITTDMKESAYEYWILTDDNTPVGYTGGHVEPETNRYFISKIYLYDNMRGKGYASQVINFYTNLCIERGLEAMYLTVNKENELGTRAYLGKGFEVIKEQVVDIGDGFVMDDYVMEKRIS